MCEMSTCSSISLLLVLACFVSGEELGVVYDITVEPYGTITVNFPSVPTNKVTHVCRHHSYTQYGPLFAIACSCGCEQLRGQCFQALARNC